jgi:AraC-like DNA-binding protein
VTALDNQKKALDFLDISPFVRYAHKCINAEKSNHKIPWRYIYDYEFLYIARGQMDVLTDEKSYTLEENDIHIIPPMLWHCLEIPDGKRCTYYSVHFDFINLGEENNFSAIDVYVSNCNRNIEKAPVNETLARRLLYTLGNLELPSKMHINDSVSYTKILDTIIKVQNEKSFAYQIDLKCNMLLLLKQILNDVRLKIVGKNKAGADNFSSVTQYLLEHYPEQISFQAISHIYGYSYSSFRRLFKEKSGKTPHEFLTDLRLERAVELLYKSEYTVSEIAAAVGYDDSAYFSRVFRLKKGCSPSAFIKSE